jgi:IS30 family transposase
MAHSQLTLAKRYKISAYLQAGISKSRIAMFIDVHRSTVYREVKRNTTNGRYHPEAAHQKDLERKHQAKNRKISDQAWSLVETLLKLDYSPEQISGFLDRTGVYSVSHEWIY